MAGRSVIGVVVVFMGVWPKVAMGKLVLGHPGGKFDGAFCRMQADTLEQLDQVDVFIDRAQPKSDQHTPDEGDSLGGDRAGVEWAVSFPSGVGRCFQSR